MLIHVDNVAVLEKFAHLAKVLEDRNENLFRGPVWILAVLLAEPAAGKPFQVHSVRPLSRQSLIHVFGVTEKGVPVMTGGEVHFVLHCPNLKKNSCRYI